MIAKLQSHIRDTASKLFIVLIGLLLLLQRVANTAVAVRLAVNCADRVRLVRVTTHSRLVLGAACFHTVSRIADELDCSLLD